ncbi:hypothetical protein SUGI_0078360 [Cryptomeria japonica]|nr:hypothetical protein SUGI_0078360 [Cryptomeria japonica]
MKVISWNIWGLNDPEKCHLLKQLITLEAPNIIFIQETKVDLNIFKVFLPRVLKYGDVVVVAIEGQLVALWCYGIS